MPAPTNGLAVIFCFADPKQSPRFNVILDGKSGFWNFTSAMLQRCQVLPSASTRLAAQTGPASAASTQ